MANNKIKGTKTAPAPAPKDQGKFRWSIEYRNGKVMDKYNEDGTKNVYSGRDETGKAKVHVNLRGAKTIGLTDPQGKVVALIDDVPEDAVVFQRRRVRDINYYNRFHDMPVIVPECVIDGRYYPERRTTHRYPEYTYGECWLIGWHKREADGTKSARIKTVYPDGKVDEFTEWHTRDWMKEPEFFDDECVDADDIRRRDELREAKKQHTVKEYLAANGNK